MLVQEYKKLGHNSVITNEIKTKIVRVPLQFAILKNTSYELTLDSGSVIEAVRKHQATQQWQHLFLLLRMPNKG